MNADGAKRPDFFLVLGICAVLYGLVIGPLIRRMLDWGGDWGLFITCIALGILCCVLGVGRMQGWSD